MPAADAQRVKAGVQTIRAVVVAQDERLRARAREALATAGVWVIGEAVEAQAAVVMCVVGRPDVVVLDAPTLWDDWSATASRIRQIRPEPRILVCRFSPSRGLLAAPATMELAVAGTLWVGLTGLVRCGGPPPRADHKGLSRR